MKDNCTTGLKQKPSDGYIGRFAPSPTGHLHMGSLLAAVISYCQARSHYGQWLIRIEDLDPPRELDGATESIINTLHQFGFDHDGSIIMQSDQPRQEAYFHYLKKLQDKDLLYQCNCSRRKISGHSIYPGYCRNKNQAEPELPYSLRVKVPNKTYELRDVLQGHYSQNLANACGDFNLLRKDKFICYQLAVVVDDAHQKITQVVRGIDILESTPRQLFLIDSLNFEVPEYAHFPVIVGDDKHKLSKQTFAREIHLEDPYQMISICLDMIGMRAPNLRAKSPKKLLSWAINNWNLEPIRNKRTLQIGSRGFDTP